MSKANPINISLIDHVVIRVNDLQSMTEFYQQVLGCRLERGPGKLGLVQLRAGQSLVDLVDAKGPLGKEAGAPPLHAAANMDHLCLQVQPWDFPAIKAHLQAHGVETGVPGSRYGALGQGPSVYFRDPEGNTLELKGSTH